MTLSGIESNQSTMLNVDCMDFMREVPDAYFDIAITDPPYGIGITKQKLGRKKYDKDRWVGERGKIWDDKPPDGLYFDELMRVSKKQIIWGGNFFDLPKTAGWIYWNKMRGKNVSFSDGELAWTRYLTALRQLDCVYDGFRGADDMRIHPTQKPVSLYLELLKVHAKDCALVLDTHAGSGSLRIACDIAGIKYVGCEIDKDYYEAQEKRWAIHSSQLTILKAAETSTKQLSITDGDAV